MISRALTYCRESAVAFGECWNEFWLRPSNPRPLGILRIGVGLLVLLWFASFAADLVTLFGSDGLLSVDGVTQWEQTAFTVFDDQYPFADANRRGLPPSAKMSILALCDSPAELWTAWTVAMLATLMFTTGIFTRATSIVTWLMFLSFVNRAPLLCGPFEAVAAMLLLYLMISPCGAVCSVDRWRCLRNSALPDDEQQSETLCDAPPRWLATVTLRLIQVHLCAIYLFMALAQWGGGGGQTPWATGEAAWLIGARPSSGLGFQWLASAPILIDFWTHGMWVFEFAFPLLIWIKRARPLLVVMATLVWLAFAALSGLYAFSLLILVAGFAFWPAPESSR